MDVNYDDHHIEHLVLECHTESVEASEDSDTDSDNDEGEIWEIDEEVGESDEDERAVVDGQPLPYKMNLLLTTLLWPPVFKQLRGLMLQLKIFVTDLTLQMLIIGKF